MTVNPLPLLTPLPVETLVPGEREHTNHHKIIHAWLNANGGTFGAGGGTSRVLARWEWRDTVQSSRSVPEAIDDDSSIGAVTFSLIVPPRPGRTLTWDLMHMEQDATAAQSVFPDDAPPPPIMADTPNSNGIYTLLFDTPYAVKAGDALYGVVTDGASARWMVMKALAANVAPSVTTGRQATETDTALASTP